MARRSNVRKSRRIRAAGSPAQSHRSLYRRRLRLEPLEDRRLLALVTVTTLADTVDFTDGVTSLREAIFATNLVSGPDEIDFDFVRAGPATIVLTEGELAITDDLTITGPGAGLLTIDASGNDLAPDSNNGDGSRIFNIDDGNPNNQMSIVIGGLTLRGGDIKIAGGGAILSREDLEVVECIITNNSAAGGGDAGSGGGIFVRDGRLRLVRSVVEDNFAGRDGGGVFARNAEVWIEDSIFAGNLARAGGGIGVRSSNSVITGSLILDNRAQNYGGGIMTRGLGAPTSTRIANSTISGNVGGAIFNYAATTTVEHSTIAGNSAQFGGSISVSADGLDSTVELSHSIVSGSTNLLGESVPDFGSSFFSLTHIFADFSIIESPGEAPIVGASNQLGVDPLLAPLADNGGPTLTHALLAGSPAIDAGDPAAVAGENGVPEFDQRGYLYARVLGGRIDMGAVESMPAGLLPGDYNSDGIVDAADYSVWRNNAGQAVSLANETLTLGQATDADYDLWRAHYGQSLALGSGGLVSHMFQATEPLAEPGADALSQLHNLHREGPQQPPRGTRFPGRLGVFGALFGDAALETKRPPLLPRQDAATSSAPASRDAALLDWLRKPSAGRPIDEAADVRKADASEADSGDDAVELAFGEIGLGVG